MMKFADNNNTELISYNSGKCDRTNVCSPPNQLSALTRF